jgi:hypothetical protein
MNNISNTNSVSVYGETLAVIKELKNLGLLKSSKPKKKRTSSAIPNDAKQESDLTSYTTPLQNIPIFRPITDDMNQAQIEDAQRRQAIDFATLSSEVKQQRLEDIDFQQRQRFDDIQRIGTILNNFFTSTPEKPFDPLANLNPQKLERGIPDITEKRFEGGINEGAPDIKTKNPTEVYATEDFAFEEEKRPQILQPREPVGKKRVSPSLRAQTVLELGLGPPPKQKADRAELVEYYRLLRAQTGEAENINAFSSKQGLFDEIYKIIDKLGEGK